MATTEANRARAKVADESASARTLSHGRGGAGNIGKEQATSGTGADLVTPTIKQQTYTTGRGGSGNMANNNPDHPEVARAAQDITAPVPKDPETSVHVGRGGGGNVAKPSEEQARAAKEANQKNAAEKEGGVKHLLEKVGLKK